MHSLKALTVSLFFGIQLRDAADVCYSWASVARGDLSLDCLSNDQMLWEGALSFARGLRSPEEVCRFDEKFIFPNVIDSFGCLVESYSIIVSCYICWLNSCVTGFGFVCGRQLVFCILPLLTITIRRRKFSPMLE